MGTWIIIFCILLVCFYFLKKSKSDYFEQDRKFLASNLFEIRTLLYYKGRSITDVNLYCEAYEFFCKFTAKFDGATIVKDLYDYKNLDLDAMYHDYECLIGANRNFIKWYKAAWRYFENMRKNGKGNQIFRFALLCIAGIIFVPYCYLLTPKYYNNEKIN